MSKTIFLIDGISSLENLKNFVNSNGDSKLFSLDYSSHKKLKKNNISHIVGETHLTSDDEQKIDDLAIQLTLNWHNNSNQKFNFFEINLLEIIESELFQFFTPIVTTAYLITKIIKFEKPDVVFISSPLSSFVEKLCKTQNIKFQSLNNSESLQSIYSEINLKFKS